MWSLDERAPQRFDALALRADAIFERAIASELYSTSGDYDLLMKLYIDDSVDIGKFIDENVANVPGIFRTLTTLTFKAF